jgi:cell division control protein 6
MFQDENTRNTLFRSESALSTDYRPDETVGREAELNEIADALNPLTRGKPPENLMVYGPAGTGKTTAVKHVLEQLDDQTRARTVYVNCWQYTTRSSLLSHLLIQLGYPAPRKGKPIDAMLLKLKELLDKNSDVALVLDEFDQHQDQTEVIYDLLMCREDAENELGLILVSNQSPEDLDINPRSESRLNYRPVHFEPYDSDDLYEILEDRAETALRRDAVTDDALRLIADRAEEQGGDCRHAIELLHRAARIADRENNDQILAMHARQSFNPARG